MSSNCRRSSWIDLGLLARQLQWSASGPFAALLHSTLESLRKSWDQMAGQLAGRSREVSEPLSFDALAEGKALVRLWPASIRAAQWPPAEVIQDLKLEALGALI